MVKAINLKEKADSAGALFEYLRVGTLNDHMLNVLQAEHRTLAFHVHEDSDELFFVIEGEMQIEFEDGLADIRAGELLIVPKGTRHRPVCKELVKCLLIEVEGTLNVDNTGGTYNGQEE